MNSNTAKQNPTSIPSSSSSSDQSSDSIKMISARQSNELIIGFCGAIGSGVKSVRLAFESNLKKMDYEIHHIHLSSLMSEIDNDSKNTFANSYERYIFRQEQGNRLRQKFNSQIMAEAAISEITKIKQKVKIKNGNENDESKFTGRHAYFIDQLKNPQEVELLRLVYQNNFYLVGVLRNESERKRNLRDETIIPKDIDDLIHRDRKSGGGTGQQTEKTILDADFFIRNNHSHVSYLDSKINRFVNLIHGKNGVSPSFHEKGMFNAYSASLQSACLSRQVGAAILDESGSIISTGRNDVPKAGGGLYTYEDAEHDYRCIHKGGKCYNDFHKNKIKDGITAELKKNLSEFMDKSKFPDFIDERTFDFISQKLLSQPIIDKITNDIFNETAISDLIEYSRAIHAEMDAITSLARSGDASTKNKIMFTTTYPCHNCARHIVASGIKEVYYIQPYEKSLALDLHDDAINDSNTHNESKLSFIQFDGVSPRRYHKFFFATAERKNANGIAVPYATKYSNHVDIQLLDSYQEIEDKVTEAYSKKIGLI